MDYIIDDFRDTPVPECFTIPQEETPFVEDIYAYLKEYKSTIPALEVNKDLFTLAEQIPYYNLLQYLYRTIFDKPIHILNLYTLLDTEYPSNHDLDSTLNHLQLNDTYSIFITQERFYIDKYIRTPFLETFPDITQVIKDNSKDVGDIKIYKLNETVVCIYVEQLTLNFFKCLTLCLKYLFNVDLPNKLIHSLCQNKTTTLCKYTKQIYIESIETQRLLFKENRVKRMTEVLLNCEAKTYASEKESVEREIQNLESAFASALARRETILYKLFYLEHQPALEQELKTMLLTSPYIKDIAKNSRASNEIHIRLHVPCANFARKDAEMVYRDSAKLKQDPLRRELFKQIFLDGTIFFWFKAQLALNIIDKTIDIVPTPSTLSGVPNVHMYNYRCWAQNRAEILDAFRKNQYVTMLYLIISGVSNLSIHDGTVLNFFIDNCLDVSNNRHPCLTKTKEPTNFLTLSTYYGEAATQ